MVISKFSYKRRLYKPVKIFYTSQFCYINDFFLKQNLN